MLTLKYCFFDKLMCFSEQSLCSDDIAAKAFKASKRDVPATTLPDLNVNIEGRQIFSVANTTSPPQLELHLGAHMSVLGAIYPHTEISYETLTGSIAHDNNQWLISIEGHVTSCPGKWLNTKLKIFVALSCY